MAESTPECARERELPEPPMPHDRHVAAWLVCFANFFAASVGDGLGPMQTVYLVGVKGWTPGRAGLVWTVRELTSMFASPLVGWLYDMVPHKRLLFGTCLFFLSGVVMILVYTTDFYALLLRSFVAGILAAALKPGVPVLLLDIAGHKSLPLWATRAEMLHHSGTVVTLLCAGFVSYWYYPHVQSLFVVFAGFIFAASICVACIPGSALRSFALKRHETLGCDAISGDVDKCDIPAPSSAAAGNASTSMSHGSRRPSLGSRRPTADLSAQVAMMTAISRMGSRGSERAFEETPSLPCDSEASSGGLTVQSSLKEVSMSYYDLLWEPHLMLWAMVNFLTHFANAPVLPLTMQVMTDAKEKEAMLWSVGLVVLANFISVPCSAMLGRMSIQFGWKGVAWICWGVIVPRCLLIVILMQFADGSKLGLLSTAVFDGFGAASHGLVATVVTNILMQDTEKFGSAFGIVHCFWQGGAALGNLAFGYLANSSYEWAFLGAAFVGSLGLLLMVPLRLESIASRKRHQEGCLKSLGPGALEDTLKGLGTWAVPGTLEELQRDDVQIRIKAAVCSSQVAAEAKPHRKPDGARHTSWFCRCLPGSAAMLPISD